MGGCSVLVLLSALLAVGAAFLAIFLGALGLFLVAVVLTIVFAVRTPRRRAAGCTATLVTWPSSITTQAPA